MKKWKWFLGLIVIFLAFWITHRVYQKQLQQKYGMNQVVAGLKIEKVNLDQVQDGIYDGSYGHDSIEASVQVVVQSHQIEDVIILQGGVTKQGKRAELIVERILEEQKNDVDVISGATVTSKALLKAVESALKKGIVKASAN